MLTVRVKNAKLTETKKSVAFWSPQRTHTVGSMCMPSDYSKPSKQMHRAPKPRFGGGTIRAPRQTLRPGAVTRREWLRFLRDVHPGEVCSCCAPPHRHAVWSGSLTRGYGRFFWRGRRYLAHRFAFIALGGVIPDGMELDHLCRMPA